MLRYNWIYCVLVVLVTEIESTQLKVRTSCPVSDLKIACSSSNSVYFKWKLNTKWTGSCRDQILKVKYFIPEKTENFYTQVDVLKKELLINGLQKDMKYEFKFVHYMNHDNNLVQVKNGYKMKEAVPHEVGVKNLTVNPESMSAQISWKENDEAKCISHYLIKWCWLNAGEHCKQVALTTNIYNYTVPNLTPCTLYWLSVTAVDVDQVMSSKSASLQLQTTAGARTLPQQVENVMVTEQTADSLTFNWAQPSVGSECLKSYEIVLYDSEYKQVNRSSVPANVTSFAFNQLKQCSTYYFYIRQDFGNNDEFVERFNLSQTFTVTSDRAVVANLSMKTTWSSVHIEWSPPLGYEACTRQYEVRVCSRENCVSATLNTTSYSLQELPACVSYTAEVRAERSPALSVVAGSTRDSNAVHFDLVRVFSKSWDSVILGWNIAESFQNCEGRFVVSLRDDESFTIVNNTLDRSVRQYKVENLKPCHSYTFMLALKDINERSIIVYTGVKETTMAAGDEQIKGLQAIPSSKSITLSWFMDSGMECVTQYKVTLNSRDGSYTIYETEDSTFRWFGDPCETESVTVQPSSENQLVGKPVNLVLRTQFEDLSKLSVKTDSGAREVKLLLTSEFLCVSDYAISWLRVANRSTSDIVANLSSVGNQITISPLEPCSMYSVSIAPRNRGTVIGVVSRTVTTLYSEPELVAEIRPLSQGFNVSWKFRTPDTKHCLSHVEVTVQNENFMKQVAVFNDSYVIKDLIPCEKYWISLEGFGKEAKRRIFYKNRIHVNPEVLPVPKNAMLVNVTRQGATLEWDVGTTENNFCEPNNVEVVCRPSLDFNVYSAGWSPAVLRIMKLQPYTRYDCDLYVVNAAGLSNATHVSFFTLEDKPSEPQNVTVVARSLEVTVTWLPPSRIPGVLLSHEVLVYNQSLLFPPPAGCSTPTISPRTLVVDGTTTQIVVAELRPATAIWIVVRAATAAGYGPLSKPVGSATLVGASDPVEDLNVTILGSEVSLTWRQPCLTNGLIEYFTIELNGTRPNHATAFYSANVTSHLMFKNYSTSFNISLLTAESVYSATVIPLGMNGMVGQRSSRNFAVPSRIPSRPNNQVFSELPLVRTTLSTATIFIRSDLFPDIEGAIRYYAVIVASNFSYEPRSGWVGNNSWPTMKTWAAAIQSRPIVAYQATPPRWEPFKDTDTYPFAIKPFTLGSEECSKTALNTFCNGPLTPGASYSVRIRAFTYSGFRDSASITFQTVDPVVEAYLVILVLVMLALVTTIAFVYLVVTAHVKWNKEKKHLVKKLETPEKDLPGIRGGLSLVEFISHVENIMTSKSMLEEEYDEVSRLTIQLSGTVNTARLSQNVKKNRYKNIIPYDSNLVKLDGEESNSYINASLIKFREKNSKDYIATQAPKEETCEDFWRMVVQYKVNVIVMLCLIKEKEKVKCFPYFPMSSGKFVSFGAFNVFCTQEEVFDDYTVRHLIVKEETKTRQVKHYHFQQWMDHEVPNKPEMLVDFVNALRKSGNKQKPMVIHCSAGVGRTGTFIVVDELLQKIRSDWRCKVNIPDTVLQMRQQRHHLMVQTKQQYVYIYACLKHALEHHVTLSEKVRNAAIKRSKVDLPGQELIQMDPNSQIEEVKRKNHSSVDC